MRWNTQACEWFLHILDYWEQLSCRYGNKQEGRFCDMALVDTGSGIPALLQPRGKKLYHTVKMGWISTAESDFSVLEVSKDGQGSEDFVIPGRKLCGICNLNLNVARWSHLLTFWCMSSYLNWRNDMKRGEIKMQYFTTHTILLFRSHKHNLLTWQTWLLRSPVPWVLGMGKKENHSTGWVLYIQVRFLLASWAKHHTF